MLDLGFVEATKVGKWTYYKRNDQTVLAVLHELNAVLENK